MAIDREDRNGIYQTIPVPLIYSTKEKFIQRINSLQQPNDDTVTIEETLPKMSFELTGMVYDGSRKENTIQKMRSEVDDSIFMFQRVPYNLNFTLNIATRKIDDSLRIVEQIVPYFTPELTLKIIDIDPLQIETNIPIALSATNFEIDSQGVFDDRRTVFWSLDFSLQAYLYPDYRDNTVIKRAIMNVKDLETSNLYENIISEVDPLDAESTDDYEIITKITNKEINYAFANTGQDVMVNSLEVV